MQMRWLFYSTFIGLYRSDGHGFPFSLPNTKALGNHFGHPTGNVKVWGFPFVKMLALFQSGTGLLLKVIASPFKTHDGLKRPAFLFLLL